MRKYRHLTFTMAACVAVVVLAGCGGGTQSSGDRQVASLDTPSSAPDPTTTSSSPEQDGQRPQVTLNMTHDEQFALLHAWQACLMDHGVPPARPNIPEDKNNSVAKGADKSKYPQAYEACHSMKPIPAPELDADTNPHYMDSYSKMIECINEKGLKVNPLPNGGGWNYAGPNTLSPEQENEIHYTCRRKAFSDDLS